MMTSQKVAQPTAAVASYSTSRSEVRALEFYKTTRSKPCVTVRSWLQENPYNLALVKGDNFFTPTMILRKER